LFESVESETCISLEEKRQWEPVSQVGIDMMTIGKVVAMGEGYLQVMKTEHIGLLSLALTEKPLISLLNTTPHESLTLSANM